MRGATIKSRPERSDYLPILMGNSVTFVMGDLVTVDTNGLLQLVTNSDEKICGVVRGFVGKHGESLDFAAAGNDDRFTSASDNSTVAMNRAIVDVGREIWIQIDADASLAQTNLFQYFDTNNSYEVDVADASDTSGALQLIKLDPEGVSDASMGLYRIADHQFGHLDS
jgi:hypothetical protein